MQKRHAAERRWELYLSVVLKCDDRVVATKAKTSVWVMLPAEEGAYLAQEFGVYALRMSRRMGASRPRIRRVAGISRTTGVSSVIIRRVRRNEVRFTAASQRQLLRGHCRGQHRELLLVLSYFRVQPLPPRRELLVLSYVHLRPLPPRRQEFVSKYPGAADAASAAGGTPAPAKRTPSEKKGGGNLRKRSKATRG